MKPILIDKVTTLQDSISIKEVYLPHLDSPFHFHNAYELVLILKGEGKRIVGDHVGNFSIGDLVLLGPKLPHVWYTDYNYLVSNTPNAVEAIVIYFHPEWLKINMLNSLEFSNLETLVAKIPRGILVNGDVKERIIKKVKKFRKVRGLDRVINLLKILEVLSASNSYQCLASTNFCNSQTYKSVTRIEKVYQFILLNFSRKITLDEIATTANLTPNAFCKYFKFHTQKTFSSFLNEIRIDHACKLLRNTEYSVSQVYFECGYNNFSNFNRCFKQFKKMSPTEYRNRFSEISHNILLNPSLETE